MFKDLEQINGGFLLIRRNFLALVLGKTLKAP